MRHLKVTVPIFYNVTVPYVYLIISWLHPVWDDPHKILPVMLGSVKNWIIFFKFTIFVIVVRKLSTKWTHLFNNLSSTSIPSQQIRPEHQKVKIFSESCQRWDVKRCRPASTVHCRYGTWKVEQFRGGTTWKGDLKCREPKNWILPKEKNRNRFFWDSLAGNLENHLCPSMWRMEGAWLWTRVKMCQKAGENLVSCM
jgi:hypothetical protein